MASKSIQPAEIGPLMGLRRRGDLPPLGYADVCTNYMFHGDILYPRPAFEQIRTLGLVPLRSLPFKLSSNPIGSRWLMLLNNPVGPVNEIYDVTVGGPSTLVYTGMDVTRDIDICVQVMFDRAFISSHDRVQGGITDVILWDPVLMAGYPGPAKGRLAGATLPTGTFTVAVSATNGNVEPGLHIYAVAWETDTGHVSMPNLYVSLTSPGGTPKCVDLTAIPLGPTGTVARWILMTRVVQNWDGNLFFPKLFFAKRIGDNITTSLTGTNAINLYDSQLQADADYLKDLFTTIPSGVGITLYSNRLILGNVNIPAPAGIPGGPPFPPKAERSMLLGSKAGFPETMLRTEGAKQISKSEGGGIKHLSEVNGFLIARKSFMTFALQDNGGTFNEWPLNQSDLAAGTEPHGVATYPGTSAGSSKSRQIVCDRSGLLGFDGIYQDRALSWGVEDIWKTIDPARFAEIMVTVDPERNRLVVLLPPHESPIAGEGTYNNTDRTLLGDYGLGLDPDNIRWSYWTRIIPGGPSDCVGLNFDYRESLIPSLTAVMANQTIQALPNDLVTSGIGHTSGNLQLPMLVHPAGGRGHLEAVRVRTARIASIGGGTFGVQVLRTVDDIDQHPKQVDISAATPGFDHFQNVHVPFNRSYLETLYLLLATNSSCAISKLWVWIRPDEDEKPA